MTDIPPAPDKPNIDMPGEQMPYPKNESHCHGAPVKKLDYQEIKYFCTECSNPCIPRQKK